MAKGKKGRKRVKRKDKDSKGKVLTERDIEHMDFWNRKPIPEEKQDERLEVDPISDKAIKNGSFLSNEEIKAFQTYLAADGRDNYCEVVVLAVDIRKSSITLINVEDFAEYHRVLTDFICYIKNTWCGKMKGRFFDKFTGDGVLCFWVLPEEPIRRDAKRTKRNTKKPFIDYYYDIWNQRIKETIEFSIEITCKFMEVFLPGIRRTCGLIPKDFGFSIGIDAGECLLTELKSSTKADAPEDCYEKQYGPIIYNGDGKKKEKEPIRVANNVTMIGRPVIGATRMVTAAKAYEILVNCYPGSALKANIDGPREHEIHKKLCFGLDLVFRKVKEYCYGPVEMYRVNTDRIEHLKKELGLLEEDRESSNKGGKEPSDTTCTQPKKE